MKKLAILGDYQQTRLSEYARIYDIIIARDHIFRRMNEEIDFSIVRKELQDKYSIDMGCSAKDPVRIFKYLMLKAMHPASDEDLVKRVYTDMSYKFFLGLNPEDDMIPPLFPLQISQATLAGCRPVESADIQECCDGY